MKYCNICFAVTGRYVLLRGFWQCMKHAYLVHFPFRNMGRMKR